uniref:EB domain-containing protein n=1 Tax=Ascaris lumbricoides TaxID=6252 RepID=A0A0M3I0X1_ASCLU
MSYSCDRFVLLLYSMIAANPGESCGRGERCEGESFCNRNLWKCVCPMEMIKIGNKCHPRLKSAPGFPCNNGEICIGGSYCQDDTCVCAPSQVRQKRQCVARKRVAAGSRCTSADICVGLSHCIGGFCQCEDGRIERRGECATILKGSYDFLDTFSHYKCFIAQPGLPCGHGEKCIGGSFCDYDRKICSCPSGFSVTQGTCQPPIEGNLFGVFSRLAKKCFIAQPGLPCGYGEKCIGGSFCDYDRKICSCPSGFSVTQGICQPPIDAMTIDIQAVELTWNTVPSQTSSTAVTSTVNTPSKPTMISRYATEANRRANLLLETSTQRYTSRRSESSTLGQTTSAVSGRERLHHTTHSTRSIQPGRCRTDEECSGGTQCAQGYCLCPVHQIMNDGHCQSATTEAPKPKVATGERVFLIVPEFDSVSRPCVASNQCADGAECISGVCRCPEGTVDSRHGFCIPLKTAHPLMSCMEGQPCGGGSACANGICVCPEGRRYIINNTCVPPVGGESVLAYRCPIEANNHTDS